jgi:hypothetical protein
MACQWCFGCLFACIACWWVPVSAAYACVRYTGSAPLPWWQLQCLQCNKRQAAARLVAFTEPALQSAAGSVSMHIDALVRTSTWCFGEDPFKLWTSMVQYWHRHQVSRPQWFSLLPSLLCAGLQYDYVFAVQARFERQLGFRYMTKLLMMHCKASSDSLQPLKKHV